jgi:hypothetical protein
MGLVLRAFRNSLPKFVMARFMRAIHVFSCAPGRKTWMTRTSRVMTVLEKGRSR